MQSEFCPLCRNPLLPQEHLTHQSGSVLHICPKCFLHFKDQTQHPSPEIEDRVYRQHQNDPFDPGYRSFSHPLVDSVIKYCSPNQVGLDYGCGAGSAVAEMLKESGYRILKFDPLFYPDYALLNDRFDFVAASEVLEHFKDPFTELKKLVSLVRPSGHLIVSTSLIDAVPKIEEWYYVRDPTHVTFYSKRTLEWIAREFNLQIRDILVDRIAIFKRRPHGVSIE